MTQIVRWSQTSQVNQRLHLKQTGCILRNNLLRETTSSGDQSLVNRGGRLFSINFEICQLPTSIRPKKETDSLFELEYHDFNLKHSESTLWLIIMSHKL